MMSYDDQVAHSDGWPESPQPPASRADFEDFGEERANLRQRIGALQRRVTLMEKHRSEGGMNELALRVAQMTEDEFAKHHEGGRTQRLAKLQVIVREALREMLIGERKWDAWAPDRCGRPPREPEV